MVTLYGTGHLDLRRKRATGLARLLLRRSSAVQVADSASCYGIRAGLQCVP